MDGVPGSRHVAVRPLPYRFADGGWVTIDEFLEFACDLAGLPSDTHTLFGNSGEEEDEERHEALEQ